MNDEESDLMMLGLTPSCKPTDIEQVKNGLAIKSVMIQEWVKSLTLKDLQDMNDIGDKQGKAGNISTVAKPYIAFIKEAAVLEDLGPLFG